MGRTTVEDGRLEHRGRWETTEVPEATGSYGVHWFTGVGLGLCPTGMRQKGGEHNPPLAWAKEWDSQRGLHEGALLLSLLPHWLNTSSARYLPSSLPPCCPQEHIHLCPATHLAPGTTLIKLFSTFLCSFPGRLFQWSPICYYNHLVN